jgi:hypothetical protein
MEDDYAHGRARLLGTRFERAFERLQKIACGVRRELPHTLKRPWPIFRVAPARSDRVAPVLFVVK